MSFNRLWKKLQRLTSTTKAQSSVLPKKHPKVPPSLIQLILNLVDLSPSAQGYQPHKDPQKFESTCSSKNACNHFACRTRSLSSPVSNHYLLPPKLLTALSSVSKVEVAAAVLKHWETVKCPNCIYVLICFRRGVQSVAVFPTFVISSKSFHLSELIFLAENLRMWGGGGKGTQLCHTVLRETK